MSFLAKFIVSCSMCLKTATLAWNYSLHFGVMYFIFDDVFLLEPIKKPSFIKSIYHLSFIIENLKWNAQMYCQFFFRQMSLLEKFWTNNEVKIETIFTVDGIVAQFKEFYGTTFCPKSLYFWLKQRVFFSTKFVIPTLTTKISVICRNVLHKMNNQTINSWPGLSKVFWNLNSFIIASANFDRFYIALPFR